MTARPSCPCCGRIIPPSNTTTLHVSGSSFLVRDPDFDRPEMIGDGTGNVAFPARWTREERRIWRTMMDMPGREWPASS